jgi:hypothetical protein
VIAGAMAEIQVVHDIPGRLRLRLPHPAHTEGLRDAVATQPGVTECTWSPRTRSMLLRYQPETATAAALIASVAQHAGLNAPTAAADEAAAMRATDTASFGVREVFDELDRRVRRVTGDRAGLGGLFPLALTVWAVTEVVRGRTAPLAWSSALWYAHGLYRDYNMTPRE